MVSRVCSSCTLCCCRWRYGRPGIRLKRLLRTAGCKSVLAEYIGQQRATACPPTPDWSARQGGSSHGVGRLGLHGRQRIPGQWRRWARLPFDRDGDVVVPCTLIPAYCDAVHGHGVYVGPGP